MIIMTLVKKVLYGIGFTFFFFVGLFMILKEMYDYLTISIISFGAFVTRGIYKKGGDDIRMYKKILLFWLSAVIATAVELEDRGGNPLPNWLSDSQTKLLSAVEPIYEEAELLVSRWL